MSTVELAGITSLPAIAYILYLSIGGVYYTSPVIVTLAMLSAISAGITQILNARNTYHGEHLILDIRNIMIISSISLILMACPLLAPSFCSAFWGFLTAHPITTPILLITTTVLVSYTMHLNMISSFPKDVNKMAEPGSEEDNDFDLSEENFEIRMPRGLFDDHRNEQDDSNSKPRSTSSESDYPLLQENEFSGYSIGSNNYSFDTLTNGGSTPILKKNENNIVPNDLYTSPKFH